MTPSLGQVFLHNETTLERITKACRIEKQDIVFEIGGGHGELTKHLINKAEKVITCEVDEKLIPYLRELNVEVINKDFMQVEVPESVNLIIGNIPYYLSSEITEKVLKLNKRAVLLYQWEFAKRLIAKPGSNNYSRLSILVQYLSKPKLLFKISRYDFKPVPKVDSALVEFQPIEEEYNEKFLKFIKILFQFKNKTVRNALISGRRLWTSKSKSELRKELTQFMNRKVYTLSINELKQEFKKYNEC